jgi:hypothetical protein
MITEKCVVFVCHLCIKVSKPWPEPAQQYVIPMCNGNYLKKEKHFVFDINTKTDRVCNQSNRRWGDHNISFICHCYWSACTKPGMWAVMYMYVSGIHFALLLQFFSIWIWNCSDGVVFLYFISFWKMVCYKASSTQFNNQTLNDRISKFWYNAEKIYFQLSSPSIMLTS